MSQRILLKKHSKTCIGYFVIDLLITQFVFRLVHASCSWKQHLMISEKWSSLQWPCFSPRCPQTQIWSSIEANSFVLERNSHKGKFCVRNWIYFNQADSQSWLTKLFLNVATDLVYCLSLSVCICVNCILMLASWYLKQSQTRALLNKGTEKLSVSNLSANGAEIRSENIPTLQF